MTNQRIYQGEDYGLILRAIHDDSDTPVSLSEYDVEILLSSAAAGISIFATTKLGAHQAIVRRLDGALVLNISGKQTADLYPGELLMEVSVIDIASGVKKIAKSCHIIVEESKIGRL